MGMFDYLICEFPLKHNPSTKVWQTKSLDCKGDVIRILSNGALQMASLGLGDNDEPENPLNVPDEDFNWYDFRGEIEFYEGYYAYHAKFYNGFLVKITCLKVPGS